MAQRLLLSATVALGLVACRVEFGEFGEGGQAAQGGGDVDRTAATSVVSGGIGGGDPAVEDCWNGTDDDANGLVDCEDHAGCGGFVCSERPSFFATWDGPVALMKADAEACYGGWTGSETSGVLLLDAPNPCGCECSAAAGEQCAASTTLFSGASCAGTPSPVNVGASCNGSAGTALSWQSSAVTLGGACTGAAADAAPPSFETRRICGGLAGGGCPSGEVCSRPPAPALVDGVCYSTPGDHPCPGATDGAGFVQKWLFFDGQPQDNRTCSGTCSCSAPSGGACSGSVLLSASGCGGPSVATIGVNGACAALPPPAQSYSGLTPQNVQISVQGSCSPSQRQVSGGFVGPVTTLCCSNGL